VVYFLSYNIIFVKVQNIATVLSGTVNEINSMGGRLRCLTQDIKSHGCLLSEAIFAILVSKYFHLASLTVCLHKV
jgi:hypothetical protein